MVDLPAIADDDERLAVFASLRDFFRYAVSRFAVNGCIGLRLSKSA